MDRASMTFAYPSQPRSGLLAFLVTASGIMAGMTASTLGGLRACVDMMYQSCHSMLRNPWLYLLGSMVMFGAWHGALAHPNWRSRMASWALDISHALGFGVGFAVAHHSLHGPGLVQEDHSHGSHDRPSPFPDEICQWICFGAGLAGAALPSVAQWTYRMAQREHMREVRPASPSVA